MSENTSEPVSKSRSITITLGALLALLVATWKVSVWANSMTSTVLKAAEKLDIIEERLTDLEGSVRVKGPQDWTRGQMDRYATDVERASADGDEWPDVWDPHYDSKE